MSQITVPAVSIPCLCPSLGWGGLPCWLLPKVQQVPLTVGPFPLVSSLVCLPVWWSSVILSLSSIAQGVVTLPPFHSYHQTHRLIGRQATRLEADGGIVFSFPGVSDLYPQKSGLLFPWLPLEEDSTWPLAFMCLFLRLKFCT